MAELDLALMWLEKILDRLVKTLTWVAEHQRLLKLAKKRATLDGVMMAWQDEQYPDQLVSQRQLVVEPILGNNPYGIYGESVQVHPLYCWISGECNEKKLKEFFPAVVFARHVVEAILEG